MGVSSSDSGRQPPEGPPVWTALKVSPFGNAAADVVNDFPQLYAHRDLNQAGVNDIAGEREHSRSRTAFGSDTLEPVGTFSYDVGT